MTKENNKKTLLKGTGLFGFVEVLRLFLRVISGKFASEYLGTYGVGILGLLENTVQLIYSFTSLGINTTGVKEISEYKEINTNELNKRIKIINLFCLFGGVLASIISLVFSSLLSTLTFSTVQYAFWFILLSFYFIFNSIIQSRTIILEGLQEYKKLVTINTVINLINTVVIIASYYFFEVQGIIIAMITSSLISMILLILGTKNIIQNTKKIQLNFKEIYFEFKKLSSAGGILALNMIIGLLCFYIIRLYFIHNHQNTELGIYNAGNMMLTGYLGIIFIAMGKLFYPKLTQNIQEKKQYNKLINDQLEISTIIITPVVLLIYILHIPLIIILFSQEFLPVKYILIFGLASTIIKGINYSTGFLLLSKGNYKTFFYINALSDIMNLLLTIFLYELLGLYGIGLAILINYTWYALYQYFYLKNKYELIINKLNYKLLLLSILSISFIIALYFINIKAYYCISIILFCIFAVYATKKLNNFLK